MEPNLTVLLNFGRRLRALARAVPPRVVTRRCVAVAAATGSAGLNLQERYVDRKLVEAAHDRGQAVWAWTVDDRDRARELIDLGVDSITTNWPARMLDVMDRPVDAWGRHGF